MQLTKICLLGTQVREWRRGGEGEKEGVSWAFLKKKDKCPESVPEASRFESEKRSVM